MFYKGKTMVTRDVYLRWKFDQTEADYPTNSPVVETIFHSPGSYIVNLRMYKPGKYTRHLCFFFVSPCYSYNLPPPTPPPQVLN